MNYLKISIVIFTTSLIASSLSAQQIHAVEKENIEGENLKTVEANISQTSAVKKEVKEELLTPEEQGFIKVFRPNGTFFYRKENNGIVVEYFPEN